MAQQSAFSDLRSFRAIHSLRRPNPLHIKNDTLFAIIPILGFCRGGLAGHLLSRRINATQFHEGLGLLFCSMGKHWYGPYHHGKDYPISGLECNRCGFRPDGRKPHLPTNG
jgi:hypothetical protein